MTWIFEEIKHRAWAAKYGKGLGDTSRYDPYELACVVEDRGDGVAYVSNASGGCADIPEHHEFFNWLKAMGFARVRWIRIIEKDLTIVKQDGIRRRDGNTDGKPGDGKDVDTGKQDHCL